MFQKETGRGYEWRSLGGKCDAVKLTGPLNQATHLLATPPEGKGLIDPNNDLIEPCALETNIKHLLSSTRVCQRIQRTVIGQTPAAPNRSEPTP